MDTFPRSLPRASPLPSDDQHEISVMSIDREHCEREVLLENSNGFPEIATFWKKAALAVALFEKNAAAFHEFQFLDEIPDRFDELEKFPIAQLSMQYASHAIKTLAAGKVALAQQYIGAAQRLQKAVACYESWTKRAYDAAIKAHNVDAHEALEMVSIYRQKQAEADALNDPTLSQQWAEAACLAQDAANKAQAVAVLLDQKTHSSLPDVVLMAAYWSKTAALWRAKVTEPLIMGDKKKELHIARIAFMAEQAATYRSKAAKTMKLRDKSISHYWSMAAYWAAYSFHYQKTYDLFFAKTSRLAEKIARAYAKAAKSKSTPSPFIFMVNFWLKRAACVEKKIKAHLL